MDERDRVTLLFGPYQAPPLKRGDRAFCLAKRVTSRDGFSCGGVAAGRRGVTHRRAVRPLTVPWALATTQWYAAPSSGPAAATVSAGPSARSRGRPPRNQR